jgi:hypothetical protein
MVKQEARKCSVNYRKRLDIHPNHLANTFFLEKLSLEGLSDYIPVT